GKNTWGPMARRVQNTEIEVFPEADCLDGFAHPRGAKMVFGHDGAQRALADAFYSGCMHHAWMFCGPAGVGKATMAYRFARAVLAHDQSGLDFGADNRDAHALAAGDEVTTGQIAALSHPRLLVIRRPYDLKGKRFSASIPVDEVRRLRSFLVTRVEGWRLVIVDSADELNINAANALLKSLEEPPEQTVFILISANPGRLLPTIRSRCRQLDFSPLDASDLTRAVSQALVAAGSEPLAAERSDALCELGKGSVRRALMLEALEGEALADDVAKVFAKLPRVDWEHGHKLAEALGPIAALERFELFFDFVSDRVRQTARRAASQQMSTSAGTADTGGGARQPGQDGAKWAEAFAAIETAKSDTLALNLDRKALIIETLGKLAQAASAR
ncbi:MAG: DNA polymerase III subunit delta', partial [Pseudomonadota bacterium]